MSTMLGLLIGVLLMVAIIELETWISNDNHREGDER